MPVVSAAGRRVGPVARVVAIGAEDVFRAFVLNTESGLRFVIETAWSTYDPAAPPLAR